MAEMETLAVGAKPFALLVINGMQPINCELPDEKEKRTEVKVKAQDDLTVMQDRGRFE
eukprot:gene6980-16721_t